MKDKITPYLRSEKADGVLLINGEKYYCPDLNNPKTLVAKLYEQNN